MKEMILWLILITAGAIAGWIARGYRDCSATLPADPEEQQQEHGDWIATFLLGIVVGWFEIIAGTIAVAIITVLIIAFISA